MSKYCDHLPLYRQEQIYWDRHQVWLPRQSMARWVQLASEWLKPIYRQIKDQMIKGMLQCILHAYDDLACYGPSMTKRAGEIGLIAMVIAWDKHAVESSCCNDWRNLGEIVATF